MRSQSRASSIESSRFRTKTLRMDPEVFAERLAQGSKPSPISRSKIEYWFIRKHSSEWIFNPRTIFG